MPFKRKSYKGRTSGRLGRKYVKTAAKKFKSQFSRRGSMNKRIRRIERTIETKESTIAMSGNIQLPHNNVTIIRDSLMATNQSTSDNMNAVGGRIGDSISLKGMAIKLFLQNSAQRPRVYYRIMVVKSARGDIPDRTKLYKSMTGNKMIDQVNTERYTIISQKIVNVTAQGAMAWTTTSGPPSAYPLTINGGDAIGGVGTKIVSMWVPGRKLARNGTIIYDNGGSSAKFFDYNLVVVSYDWYGTPQDVNNVGSVTDGWVKLYYKDA